MNTYETNLEYKISVKNIKSLALNENSILTLQIEFEEIKTNSKMSTININ